MQGKSQKNTFRRIFSSKNLHIQKKSSKFDPQNDSHMRTRVTLLLLAVVLFMACMHPSDVRQALDRQLSTYPKSTLQDVYKTFYQDRFGPSHMISDTAAVRDYLLSELAYAAEDSVENPYYEPTGAKGQFVRVYLRSVLEKRITAEQLVNAFVRSAVPVPQPDESWTEEWEAIVSELNAEQLEWLDRDSVCAQLQEAAALNRAVHHSNAYRQAYHPHYRIVEKRIFEEELRPSIDKHLPVK